MKKTTRCSKWINDLIKCIVYHSNIIEKGVYDILNEVLMLLLRFFLERQHFKLIIQAWIN